MSNTEQNTTFLANAQKLLDELMHKQQSENEQVKRQYEQAMNILQAVETGYKQTIQAQQAQIQALQQENSTLKQQNALLLQNTHSQHQQIQALQSTLDELENCWQKLKQV